ncbi:sugar ABC transporter ATP-binding protein [Cohnella soli]|uniref:Sugar ABC transporter ATP-binding protein n=1 Tax=Cohnella soli TaxID=425005 RepID=A0ABW0HXR1_9BACL
MAKALVMEGIAKAFNGVYALKGVNLDLEHQEILAIVGENGAGKSTLMKILSGSYPKSSYEGQVYVDNVQQQFETTRDSEKAGIEMIYQEISLHLDLTVAENLFLGKWPIKNKFAVDWKKVNETAERYLKLVGLTVSPKETVRNLNTSQQQLISIARAFMRNPKILVLDEPTSALTETEANNLLNVIRDLKAKGISSIYISHKLDEVFSIADRITVMRDGNVISTSPGPGADINRVVEDMVGRKIETMYPKKKVPIGEEMLRVEGLSVPHPYSAGKQIVTDVGFQVRKGEILGIAGLVGAGRSEIVNAIFGAIPKASGKVFIQGKETDIRKPLDAIKHGIGLVTENRKATGFVGTMNLRENMTLANLGKISSGGIINKSAEETLAQSYYSKLLVKAQGIKASILGLSGGNQQKIVLAKWLMTNIKILIVDEPTRGIDVGAKVEIYNLLTELAESGVAIIMISSDLPELLAMSDRFIIMANGIIGGTLTQEEATQEKVMKIATGSASRMVAN